MRDGEVAARGSMDELQNSSDEYVQGILFPEKSLVIAAQEEATRLTEATAGSSRTEQEICATANAVTQQVCRAVAGRN